MKIGSIMQKLYFFIPVLFFCLVLIQCGTAFSSQATIKIPQSKIFIDGKTGDWDDIEPLTLDVGSSDRGDSAPDIDLKSIKVSYGDDNLYLLLEAEPVGGEAIIYVDSDGDKSTGTDSLLLGKKLKSVKFQSGWDFIIKLNYSFQTGTAIKSQAMLIYQVEEFEKAQYGHKSRLVFGHKDSIQHPSYVAVEGRFQELKIPLEVLNIKAPTDITFLFMEGWGGMSTELDKHCQVIKARIE